MELLSRAIPTLLVFVVLTVFCVQSHGLCISSYQAKLYREATSDSQVSWVVGRYMPLVEVERKKNWIKTLDLDGETHWVRSSDVTTRLRCVVVRVQSSLLRKGPGQNYPLAEIQKVNKYMAFKRNEAEPEDWYQVEDESGGQYWILAHHVWKPNKLNRIGF
ncbi:MAG: hypothetical protein K1X29_02325 [Bdellovibrionales bacterium]|nr:hypothetical protein [Bdellovibrionales bacterium]